MENSILPESKEFLWCQSAWSGKSARGLGLPACLWVGSGMEEEDGILWASLVSPMYVNYLGAFCKPA